MAKEKRRFRRRLKWLFVVLFLLLVVYIVDSPFYNDDELRNEVLSVADSDNAFYWYDLAGSEFRERSASDVRIRQLSNFENWDPVLADSLLVTHNKAVENVQLGNLLDQFQGPSCTRFSDPEPDWMPFVRIGRLLNMRVYRECELQKPGELQRAMLDLMQYGHSFEKAAATLGQHLIGLIIIRQGDKALHHAIRSGSLTLEDLEVLISWKEEHPFSNEGAVAAWRNQFSLVAHLVDSLHVQGFMNTGVDDQPVLPVPAFLFRRFFQPNRTKDLLGRQYKLWMDQTGGPFASWRDPRALTARYQKSFDDFPPGPLYFLSRNSLGKLFAILHFPPLRTLAMNLSHVRSDSRATKLLLALKLYQQRNGREAQTLDELVPDILSASPVDPFDGREFRYIADRGLFYSVGVDCVDSLGLDRLLPEEQRSETHVDELNQFDITYELAP